MIVKTLYGQELYGENYFMAHGFTADGNLYIVE